MVAGSLMAAVVERPSVEERVKAALWFAERGFGVFSVWPASDAGECRCPPASPTRGKDGACSSPGKHPVTTHGFQDATTEPTRVRAMLSTPIEPNYGIVPPVNVFILDVDDDGDGIGRLARLQGLYGPLPATLRTQTANGQHIFLRWPDGLPRPISKMFGYVTRWGSGKQAGYVIGPRSVHPSGFTYAPMVGSFEIATLPDVWARAALEGEREAVVTVGGTLPSVGGRHDWLRDRARYYRGLMEDRTVLRAALLAENARLPEPKTEAEVDRAIGEVYERFPLDPPEVVEERVTRRLADDDLDILGLPPGSEFPQAPDPIAFGGLLGELVGDLEDGTDASSVGLLGSLVAFCGALIPGSAYFHRMQTSSPFIALVGESSIGRKGTAMNRAGDAVAQATDVTVVNRALLDGLNSGEGLISSLIYKREHFPQEPTVGLVFEEEYATLIASRGREGSTLDPRMRAAFDGGPLSNRKANDTKTVLPPYWLPALIGITPTELRTRLEAGALQSGSANRWLYLPVTRRSNTATNSYPEFSDEHREAVQIAAREANKRPPVLDVDPAVRETLGDYADSLLETATGLAADLTKRYAVIAFRIALVHALIERSTVVAAGHVERAVALTEYARRGVTWIFGHTIGDQNAALLYRQLVESGRLTRTTIGRLLRDPLKRQAAIDELIRIGRARRVTVQGSGRPRHELEAVLEDSTPFHPFRRFPQIPTTARDETTETAAITAKSAQEGWRKGGEKMAKSPPETVICRDYRGHQAQHRFIDGRWVCLICESTEVPAS